MSSPTLATFGDLAALPGHVRGVVLEKPPSTFEHGSSQVGLGSVLSRRFDRKSGGRWPGGWALCMEVEVEYEAHEIFTHDLAGWRRDRLFERPAGRPMTIRPDWGLRADLAVQRETRSRRQAPGAPATCRAALLDRRSDRARAHGPSLDRQRLSRGVAAKAGDTVRAEPFDAVELRVSTLFGIEDDDE
jgi:hypothetical protein